MAGGIKCPEEIEQVLMELVLEQEEVLAIVQVIHTQDILVDMAVDLVEIGVLAEAEVSEEDLDSGDFGDLIL
jgi:hypothetical protein